MRLLGIGFSVPSRYNRRLTKLHCGSTNALNFIFSRLSSVHVRTPPVFDSKVGFTDYEKERREFHINVPEYFNFANVLEEWAQKEKVRSYSKDDTCYVVSSVLILQMPCNIRL